MAGAGAIEKWTPNLGVQQMRRAAWFCFAGVVPARR